jgi:polysaccharide export outer membrane protein
VLFTPGGALPEILEETMGTRTLAIAQAAAVTILLILLASSAAAQDDVTRAEGDAPDAYVIGIGDVLEISVWKNPDLSVTVPVRPDGRISVPLLGDVQAAGMTPLALKQTLTQGLKEYVTAPGVSVVVKEIHSRRIFVTGEVAHPGAFDLQPNTKLMQALALAGGTTPYSRGRVVLLRDSRDGKADQRFEYKLDAIISGKRPQDNVLLLPGDTLFFP